MKNRLKFQLFPMIKKVQLVNQQYRVVVGINNLQDKRSSMVFDF
jgi:hypothetical protein